MTRSVIREYLTPALMLNAIAVVIATCATAVGFSIPTDAQDQVQTIEAFHKGRLPYGVTFAILVVGFLVDRHSKWVVSAASALGLAAYPRHISGWFTSEQRTLLDVAETTELETPLGADLDIGATPIRAPLGAIEKVGEL